MGDAGVVVDPIHWLWWYANPAQGVQAERTPAPVHVDCGTRKAFSRSTPNRFEVTCEACKALILADAHNVSLQPFVAEALVAFALASRAFHIAVATPGAESVHAPLVAYRDAAMALAGSILATLPLGQRAALLEHYAGPAAAEYTAELVRQVAPPQEPSEGGVQ